MGAVTEVISQTLAVFRPHDVVALQIKPQIPYLRPERLIVAFGMGARWNDLG